MYKIGSGLTLITFHIAVGANILSFATSPAHAQGADSDASRPPNIVLIMLDDVGFGDISTFGGPVQTPAFERLAREGLRYNNFHTAGICSPTRAALLSGRNHHRVGYGGFGGVDSPGYDGVWKKNAASIAKVLLENGYSTSAFGKWHNTPREEITPAGPFQRWPTGLGFEYYYGNMIGMSSQWEPPLWRNTVAVLPPKKPSEGYRYTTDIADEAIGWVRTHNSLVSEKPYFLYFSTGGAHTPHHVSREWIERYRGKFDQGWDVLREQTFERQKQLGIIPPNTRLTPRPSELPAWSSFSREEQRVLARQMEVFAGFLSHTDHEVGRLIEAVRGGPNGDNTVIIYIAGDNGDDPSGLMQGATDLYVDRPLAEQAKDVEELGGPKHTNHYAIPWTWAGSTPFQWMKFVASHLGATRNPMVISWPAGMAPRGELRPQFTHVVDIAPTIYEIAGIGPPRQVEGVEQITLDGQSLVATFADSRKAGRRTQYFEIGGNRALYHDGWLASTRHFLPWTQGWSGSKLNDDFHSDAWELYDLRSDFSQSNDLAAQYPDKLREMQALFDAEARRNDVYPLGAGLTGAGHPAPKKSRYVYHAGFPSTSLVAGVTPDFRRSHRIDAELDLASPRAQGVIIAAGGRYGGFTLYLSDGRLIYETAAASRCASRIATTHSLAAGSRAVELTIENQPGGQEARATIKVDNKLEAENDITCLPNPSVLDNFDIGKDSGEPVSDAYAAPFPLAGGSIQQVIVAVE